MFKIKSLHYTPHFVAIGMLLLCIVFVIVSFRSANTADNTTQVQQAIPVPDKSAQSQLVNLYYCDYVLRIQDDHTFVLYDTNGRIVHVFNREYKPNNNLFNVVDKDNE